MTSPSKTLRLKTMNPLPSFQPWQEKLNQIKEEMKLDQPQRLMPSLEKKDDFSSRNKEEDIQKKARQERFQTMKKALEWLSEHYILFVFI